MRAKICLMKNIFLERVIKALNCIIFSCIMIKNVIKYNIIGFNALLKGPFLMGGIFDECI